MTAQFREILILNGEETSMAFCPPLPKNDPKIVVRDYESASESCPVAFSTACWRQYIGTWEIKDDRFYLVDVVGKYELIGNEPLHATWFTGTIRIPQGEQLEYVHMGFGSVYEEELHIRIEAGNIKRSRTIDNRDKEIDRGKLTISNFPGSENRFDGDDEL